jgi:hypothetical protein
VFVLDDRLDDQLPVMEFRQFRSDLEAAECCVGFVATQLAPSDGPLQ